MNPFRDLIPDGDVKGGSPRTPAGGIRVAEFKTATPMPEGGFWRSNLFIFLLGQIFAFLCWLVLVGIMYGRFEQRINQVERGQVEDHVTLVRMDTSDTNAGRWAVADLRAQMLDNKKRLDDIDIQIRKIDVIMERITRIDDNVREIKEHQK